MGVSKGKSGSSSSSSAEFNENVWPVQEPMLQDLFQRGLNLAGNQQQADADINSRWINPEYSGNRQMNVGYATSPAWQNQLAGGAFSGVDANQVLGDIRRSTFAPSQSGQLYNQIMGGEGNVYLGGLKDVYHQDAQRTMSDMANTMDARAAGSGMSGSSRHGIAQGIGAEDINRNLQRDIATLGYETFDRDLQNKLGIASMADQNTLARQQMMMDALGQKQAAMTGGLNYAPTMGDIYNRPTESYYNTRNMEWNPLFNAGNLLGSPLVLGSGNMAGSGSSKSKGMGIGK